MCSTLRRIHNSNSDKMKTNEGLQYDVENAIKWEALMDAAEIGVTAKDGVVTLTGTVDSYAKKIEAENAAKRVAGVTALVEKIKVEYGSYWAKKDDGDIASEILNAFKWNTQVPKEKIKVEVENGWVTLEGELGWNYQKEAAKKAVKNLLGVTGVSNNIRIRSEVDIIEQKDIEAALKRNVYFNNEDVEVSVSDKNVKLKGRVDSYYAKDEAERTAWNTPGVCTVVNELIIVNNYAD